MGIPPRHFLLPERAAGHEAKAEAVAYGGIDAFRGGDAVNMAIGQGDTVATPLQMAVLYSAIANGGIVEREASIHLSNVMLIDPDTNAPTRVGRRTLADGTRVRIGRKSGAVVDK